MITAPPLSEWYESRETDGDVHPACGREALEHFVWDEAKKKNVIRCPAPVAKPPFPSPLPVPTSAPARFEMIASLRIEESDFNPRKSFDPKKQLEINASVAAKGVLEPILVRPRSANGNDYFEVVAGAQTYALRPVAISEFGFTTIYGTDITAAKELERLKLREKEFWAHVVK